MNPKNETKELFGVAFTKHMKRYIADEKKKGNKITEKALQEKMEVSRMAFYNWKNGNALPDQHNLKKICKLFNVPEGEFYSSVTNEDQYQWVTEYINNLCQQKNEFSNEIGLNTDLLKALNSLIDFGNIFPLYTPIVASKPYADFFTGEVVVKAGRGKDRWNILNAAAADPDLSFFQYSADGDKRLTFGNADLAYLKEVQDKIVEYVQFLFYQRSKEMEREVEEVKCELRKTVKIGKTADGGTSYSYGHFNYFDLVSTVDRFAQYGYARVPKEKETEGR